MKKKNRDLLYQYYCLTQFMRKPVLPKNYGKWVEGKPWHGPLVKSDYEAIEREIMLNKIILNKLKHEEDSREA